jgi:VWFA-related protein
MIHHRRAVPAALLLLILAAAGAGRGRAQDAPQQTPSFRAGVEALPVDITVVNDQGQPIRDLIASDFTVRIDGKPRRIISAQWIASVDDRKTPGVAPVPEGYASNEHAAGGRLIVLVIDSPNIPFGEMRPMRTAIEGFIDRLTSADRVAVVGFGMPSVSTPFMADKAQLKQTIARIPGQRQSTNRGIHEIGIGAAIAIDRGDDGLLRQIVLRDCVGTPRQIAICQTEIQAEATEVADEARRDTNNTLLSLREVLTSVRAIDAPKTLMLVSQGFVADRDRDDGGRISELGGLASAARTSIYSFRLEDSSDIERRKAPIAALTAEDNQARRYGLETLTFAARGALFNVAGSGVSIFERVSAELSGYYLLGVETDGHDRDGKPHPIRVDVARKGLTIRSHRTMLAGGGATAPTHSPREVVTAALSSPLPASSLALRAIAFPFRGLENGKIRLLIHADIGSSYTSPQRLSVGYYVVDKDGKTLDGQVSDVRLAPVGGGIPSPLAFSAGASVDPGDYTVRIAVADGDRIGSVELPVHADLLDLGRVRLTELIAGGPVPPINLLRPSVGTTVSFGNLHGYLEAYGPDAATLEVRFEIVAEERGAAILSADVQGQLVGDDRVIFTQMMLVQALPPGSYRLRALIRRGNALLTTLGRAFDVAPAAAITASRNTEAGAIAPNAPLYLPVDQKDMARPFNREEALQSASLQPFQDRVPPSVRAAFDEGVAHLQKRAYKDAEASFKRAIQPDLDSTGPLAYLGVTYAAAGRDAQAASVWRTTMAGADDLPELYAWLADALMRLKALGEARPVLQEAIGRWPTDARFARPLALVYATFGNGLDAARLLDQSIREQPGDQSSLFLAVEWLFNVHRAGFVVHDRAEDLRLAHAYADQYLKGGGLNEPLIKQWLSYLDKEAP